MKSTTLDLKEALKSENSLQRKVNLLKDKYIGETAYVLTCGPSINDTLDSKTIEFLKDKLVISIKQTYEIAPEVCDFQILNSWNYKEYDYSKNKPIVISERAPKDPETPGLQADLLFDLPNPSDFKERLATSYAYDKWTFDKSLDRPWGPGVMHELCFYLLVHFGVKEIITFGWDLGVLNIPTMPHFFKESGKDSKESDGILHKPRIRPYEVEDIQKSTKPLYYWLKAKGIDLYVISDQSLVDDSVPRLKDVFEPRYGCNYLVELIGNSDFSAILNNQPYQWSTSSKAVSIVTESDRNLVQIDSKLLGTPSKIYQEVLLESFFKGSSFTAKALVSSTTEKAEFMVILRGKKTGLVYDYKIKHPGNGEWVELTISEMIPDDIDDYFYLSVIAQIRSGAKSKMQVKNVECSINKMY